MKGIILSILLFVPMALLSGCCTDDLCNAGDTLNYVSTCSNCNKSCNRCTACTSCSTCNTCGYDASYTYSGWY